MRVKISSVYFTEFFSTIFINLLKAIMGYQ